MTNKVLLNLLNHFLNHKIITNLDTNQQIELKNKLTEFFKLEHLDKKLNHLNPIFDDLDKIHTQNTKQKDKKSKPNFNPNIYFDFDLTEFEKTTIESIIFNLKPWHKGIYQINKIVIDGHWNCLYKWNRLEKTLQTFIKNKTELKVLDVGSGNGYFLWKLKKIIEDSFDKPKNSLILGIDRHLLYLAQFYLFYDLSQKYSIANLPCLLPMTDSDFIKKLSNIERKLTQFDLVLSMGLLYHQKDPLNHLLRMKQCLKDSDSIFILETLITDLDNPKAEIICPENEYCKMRNVWFIPNLAMLKLWLKRLNFNHIEIINVSTTTNLEQRSTKLSQNWSAEDTIDLSTKKTIEGYDAPFRIMLKISI